MAASYPSCVSGLVECSHLSSTVASEIHERHNYQREDTGTRNFSGHGRPPSLLEYNHLPFPASPQTPVQTCQTRHPQSSSGYLPSSMEHSRFPSTLAGQTHEGPSSQMWHSPRGYSQVPFHAATQTLGELTYPRSHHPQSWLPSSVEYSHWSSAMPAQTCEAPDYQRIYSQGPSGRPPLSVEHNPLPFPACGQTPVQTSQTQSHHPQKASPADMFDVKACQKTLAEHYQKAAKVPTTAWSSVLQVDLEKIYTRLSWVKQEQTPAGSSQKELSYYTELFTEKTTKGIVAKRILVQGETGIGKTTFVKRLLVDWSNLEEAKMDEGRKDALRKFDLVVSISLKEVSKCQTFKQVVSCSRLFPEDKEKSVDDLLCYIHENQDKVLLVFDGYDEYRTGTEAEERYGNRSNSPIFEIFHGNILRDCTVLITTRSSRADELRGPADIQAEITGFNMPDRQDFMRKMLDSQSEVDGLLTFLSWNGELKELARVPLLSLFFCLLWKKEKEKLAELTERKAKLYQAIVKHILQHGHRRHSSSKASKLKETDYDEILAEIGKVALAGLLKGDLVFEFGQLPEKVHGEEGVIVGLFQCSEYGPSLEPMEMVSFIHKSVQEYLAAWYLIYSCVPKGNLGEIEEHVGTLEHCEALENVFQFACGLSDKGAMKVLERLKSVRISDPSLDLSKTIPDVESETEKPLCDVTDKQVRFSDLVCNSFREVQAKADLLSHLLDCTGGVILVTRNGQLSECIPDVNVLAKLPHDCVFRFDSHYKGWEDLFTLYSFPSSSYEKHGKGSVLYKSLEFLNCLQLPLRVTDSSEVLTVADVIREFDHSCYSCFFKSILCFHNGQFQFYITKFSLTCDGHARLFTESTSMSVPSDASSVCSKPSYLKFLSSLCCDNLSSQTVKGLGAIIGNCKHLSTIKVDKGDDSICYLLQQVRNPSKCSVTIGTGCSAHLTSAVAVQIAGLLPRFNSVIALSLDLRDCCAAALSTLVNSITHKTLENMILRGIILTPATAEALGRSLAEMSSLQILELTGADRSILQAEEMDALFGGFNKAIPLYRLRFCGFSVRSCLSPLIKCLSFFPNLRELHLEWLNIDEHDQYDLLKRFGSLTKLEVHIRREACLDSFHYYTSGRGKILELDVTSLTPALAAMLGRMLPEMSFLLELKLFVAQTNILQAAEMEALFGGFNKATFLGILTFSGFGVRSCLSPLIKSLRFFPYLIGLHLECLNIDEYNQYGLLKRFRLLTELEVRIHREACLDSFDYNRLEPEKFVQLRVAGLTPAIAAMLGRMLPEFSSLEVFGLFGLSKGNLQAAEMKALFGGFDKPVPLYKLTLSGFSARGSFSPLFRSFRFFPNLVKLELEMLNMDEHDLRGLLESFQFIPNLLLLSLSANPLGHAVTSIVPHVINLKELEYLDITNTGHSQEDLNYLRDTVQQVLPELHVIADHR